MRREDGHPDVSLEHMKTWQNVCSSLSFISEVIDRSECRIPDWFVPLARGAAIASPALLWRAGYSPGMGYLDDWYEHPSDCFRQFPPCRETLVVRMCEDTNLWAVEWLGRVRSHFDDEVLVHTFGSTPIFTRSCESAMRLAVHCREKRPPAGLRWIKACPTNLDAAIEFAKTRQLDENVARLAGYLH
jgi:hypothetical protein